MTLFPGAIDTFQNPQPFDNLDSVTVPHAQQHDNINDAVAALEAKVGIDSSADTNSLDYKVTTAFGTSAASGAGSPEGVVTGNKAKLYWNETDDSIWLKRTNGGNTG